MHIEYEPAVIRKFAADLYADADALTVRAAIRGFFLWGGASALAAKFTASGPDQGGFLALAVLVGGGIGAWVGHALAQGTANALRLQAQTALCQVQIEENVRGSR